MKNECLPTLLRAIATGSNAKESRQDVILNAAADELECLRELASRLLDNDPSNPAADAVTVLDVWRKTAARVLGLDR